MMGSFLAMGCKSQKGILIEHCILGGCILEYGREWNSPIQWIAIEKCLNKSVFFRVGACVVIVDSRVFFTPPVSSSMHRSYPASG